MIDLVVMEFDAWTRDGRGISRQDKIDHHTGNNNSKIEDHFFHGGYGGLMSS
jgi:hypothetical protein